MKRTQLRYEAAFVLIDRGSVFLISLTKWGAFCVLGYFAYRGVEACAGQDTSLKGALTVAIDAKLNIWAYRIACGLFGGMWFIERKRRKDVIQREHRRLQSFELSHDPKRSTSGVNPRGDAPEDKT